jgi:single-stranded-DNA-specific exonuclease
MPAMPFAAAEAHKRSTRLPWNVRGRQEIEEADLARRLGISTVLAALLRNRGKKTPEDALAWIQPRFTSLEDPGSILDVDKATARLHRAIRDKERILIYGDYDVDGMVGTVILVNFLRLAGADVGWYIPDRTKEGYSFNAETIDRFLGDPAPPQVIVTVDHGISANDGIARLKRGGVDVIVTDHHEPPDVLPDAAVALINPRRPGCPSRFKDLCGAAVAFKLAWATAQALSNETKVSAEFREFLVEATGFASIATVTDLVSLSADNRALCVHGFRALAASKNPGLRALLKSAGLSGHKIEAEHVAFRIGPRLNAAGRLARTATVIDMLTTSDPAVAGRLAAELEDYNAERKDIERGVLVQAQRILADEPLSPGEPVCVGARDWHAGVIGIVAARLSEQYGVPAMVVALNGEKGRGSARSPAGVHLRDVLADCADHLETFGGHAGAAGCTVTETSFPAFKEAFKASVLKRTRENPLQQVLDIDFELPLGRIRSELVAELDLLAPHGRGNPPPVFCAHGVRVAGTPSTVGVKGAHLVFYAADGDAAFRAVAFGQGARISDVAGPGTRLSIAFRLKLDRSRDAKVVELEVLDFKAS